MVQVTLSEVCTFAQGGRLKLTGRDFVEIGYPAYGAGGVNGNVEIAEFEREAIVLSAIGARCGKCFHATGSWTSLANTRLMFPDPERVNTRFLYYQLDNENRWPRSGTAQPFIRPSDVSAHRIFLPTLREQLRIVAILDEAFEGISVAADRAKKSLLYAEKVASEYLADVFEQADDDWVFEPIAESVRFIDYRGKTPPKRDAGVRLITAKNVKMGFVQRQPEEFIHATAYEGWMTRGFPKKGDVLFTTEAPLANVAQLDTDEQVVIGQRLITMQPDKKKLDPAFLKYMLLSRPLQRAIRAKGTGATVQGIKASLLKKIEIKYPRSTVEQTRIVARLDAVFEASKELVEVYERKLTALAELKQSLLASAFSGELTSEPIAA